MIRDFVLGDEKAITSIENECFSQPWSENAVTESFKSGTVFVLFEEYGNILGYGGMQIVMDEGYITNIAVTQSARRKGIGFKIVNALIDTAKHQNLSFISLEVRQSNTSAISLYEKLGFKIEGKRKNFYSRPTEDGLIMTLKEL